LAKEELVKFWDCSIIQNLDRTQEHFSFLAKRDFLRLANDMANPSVCRL